MFTLICVIVGWLIVFNFLVIFFSSKDETPADTPATQIPFLQMDSLAQKLCILGPLLGRVVQAASVSVTNSLSLLVQVGG